MASGWSPPTVEGVWTDVATVEQELSIFARRSGRADAARSFVLVHGLGVSSRYMVPLLERLAATGNAWAPDLPGFGCSPGPRAVLGIGELARVLGLWMDRVGLLRPILVGNSMGCQIITRLAVDRPAAVAAIVLIAPTMDRGAGGRWSQIARWLVTAAREPVSMVWLAIRDYLRAGFRRTWRTFVLAQASRTSPLYARVSCPALVVRGEHDLIVSQSWAERVAAVLPDARVVVLEGAAHAVQYDRPDDVARTLETFADQLRGSSVRF
jgi:2-hydroxy-6-oxonona-2,4-dienedioate hydrolase